MTIAVHNRQRRVRFDRHWLAKLASVALPKSLEHPAPGRSETALAGLEHVEIIIVSDRKIAGLHAQFMGIPGPTDVITFDHGEIVISAETAQENARRFLQSLEHELALYVIHGLLHLHGHEDATAAGAARMRRLQERILRQCLAHLG